MTNNTNLVLIAAIQNQNKLYLNFAARICQNMQVAEDLIQSIFVVLLRKEIAFEINDTKRFIFKMIVQANWNYQTVNKKYFMIGDLHTSNPDFKESAFIDNLMQDQIGCSYEKDLMDALTVKEVVAVSNTLPPAQSFSMLKMLNGHEIGYEDGIEHATDSPRYQSLKSTRNLALQKLKTKFA